MATGSTFDRRSSRAEEMATSFISLALVAILNLMLGPLCHGDLRRDSHRPFNPF
jgi:hypothetical protein